MRSKLLENLRWGLGWGLLYATAFSAWVALLSLARRSVHWPQYGMTTWGIIGAYYLAAVIVGSAVGALRPLTSFRVGTFFLGWIGGTLAYSAVAFTMGEFKEAPWWIWTVPGLMFGGVAIVMQDRDRGEVRTSRRFVAVVVTIGVLLALWMHLLGWW